MDGQHEINAFQLVTQSKGVVLVVLLVLVGMSLFSWFVIVYKYLVFRAVRRDSDRFFDIFWRSETLEGVSEASRSLTSAPVARMFQSAYAELKRLSEGNKGALSQGFENIERALRRSLQFETTHLERLVPFLATTGSSAPFIGLFGTVWGIMNAFAYISPEKPVLETVAPHIAEALIATAIGLLAAIPAVMAYNYFQSKIRVFTVEMENFSIDFLNILKRHFFKD